MDGEPQETRGELDPPPAAGSTNPSMASPAAVSIANPEVAPNAVTQTGALVVDAVAEVQHAPMATRVPVPFVRPRIGATAAPQPNEAVAASRPLLRRHLVIRNYEELRQRCSELGAADYLVENILPCRSIGLVVGDSGLGKSALLYQLGICIAGGKAFLGHAVRQGPVLYLDYENGLKDSLEMVKRLSGHVGLQEPPADFHMWHLSDCSPLFGTEGNTVFDLIKFLRPALIIVDSLSAYQPEIEEGIASQRGCIGHGGASSATSAVLSWVYTT
jgi:RecA-family ATPase